MTKETYTGLSTKRTEVECAPLMANSKANIKLRTEQLSTQEWVEVDPETPLQTSITTDFE